MEGQVHVPSITKKRKKPRSPAQKRATAKLVAMNKRKAKKKTRRKSTRKGMVRKTARRAYEPKKKRKSRTKRKTNKDSMWNW